MRDLARRAGAEGWARLRTTLERARALAAPGALTGDGPAVLLFLHSGQDLDLLLPLAREAVRGGRARALACATREVLGRSPRIRRELLALGVPLEEVDERRVVRGAVPSLLGVRALVTASESNAPEHAPAHALTTRANWRGVRTYTLQHGFENIGLTYGDADHPLERTWFASQVVFTWSARLHPSVQLEVARRCLPVGCPKDLPPPLPRAALPGAGPLVAVFENLHWRRYDDAFRARFLADVEECARRVPAATFVLKPHHAGQWLTRQRQAARPAAPNLEVLDPADPRWEPFTAPAVLGAADGVITTPSTVAVDAARAGRPVAVAGYDLDLGAYAPLPLLRGADDWVEFAARVVQGDRARPAEPGRQLLRAALLDRDGPACARAILDHILGGALPSP